MQTCEPLDTVWLVEAVEEAGFLVVPVWGVSFVVLAVRVGTEGWSPAAVVWMQGSHALDRGRSQARCNFEGTTYLDHRPRGDLLSGRTAPATTIHR